MKRIHSYFFYSVFSIVVLLPVTGSAQNWTGNLNSDWNNQANWTSWPLNGVDILIDPANYTGAAASPVISANSVFTPAEMLVQNGATLTVQANLSTTKRIELLNNGTLLSLSAGTLFAAGGGSQGRIIIGDGAAVIQNGGVTRAAQHVILETGGKYTMNSGTVTPAQDLAIGDGNMNNSSLFTMNGGRVSVGGDLGFENEIGTYYPSMNITGGDLTVGGSLSWLGVSPGAGKPQFLMSGGTATIAGSILNDPLTTVDLFMKIAGSASLSVNGSSINLVNSTDSIVQSGNSLITFSGNKIWQNPGAFYATGGTLVIDGNTTIQGAGSFEFRHLSVNSSRNLVHASPALISITGNFIHNGTFIPGNNTVLLGGSSQQQITGGTPVLFRSLVVNNSSAQGVVLGTPASVTGTLQLGNGRISTSTLNLLTLTDNAVAPVSSSLSFINGPMRKVGDDAFVFPIGKNSRWRRLAMTAPASVSAEFVAEYFEGSYPSISPVSIPLKAISNLEFWKLDRSNTTNVVQISLFWENAAASAIASCSTISTGYWNGAAWVDLPSASFGNCTSNGSGYLTTSTPVNSYGIFTFGFYGNVVTQNVTLCAGGSLTVGTNIYNTSGTYIDVLTAADMGDSTVITQLSILPKIITAHSVTICHGEKYVLGAAHYSVSGNYTNTLVSLGGCDSIVHTTLIVKPPVNVSVIQNDVFLSAVSSGADSYQWVDCNNNFAPLPGETGQSYSAAQNGDYAVVIKENSCPDTSSCFSIRTVGLDQHDIDRQFRFYPNPGDGRIFVECSQMTELRLRLYDSSGRCLREEILDTSVAELDYSAFGAGIYQLEASAHGQVVVKRMVIR